MENLDKINVEDTTAASAIQIIKPIDKDTVNKICSGQVILSLASAVKELVENALDAGATIIEIRLKDYGMQLVEVLDNGTGVIDYNFSGLTLKHYTSKLQDFSDLLGVKTFGFRGEALSSLCALSEVTITTKHSSSDHGTKIVYDHAGEIKSMAPCARQIGTTVSLTKLFDGLTVRKKEFSTGAKREFHKMLQILYAYCLVSDGVRITCTNLTSKGKKSLIVATQGGSLRDNIACVFGVKQLQTLLELKPFYPDSYVPNIKKTFYENLENPDIISSQSSKEEDITDIKSDSELQLSEESSNDCHNTNDETVKPSQTSESSSTSNATNSQSHYASEIKRPFDFTAYVSSCAHGNGHSTNERQFFYVNSRPCEPMKVMKLVNEVYRQYNADQTPFVFLNIKIKGSAIDLNVTPDKRKIFLNREKHLMEIVKTSLLKCYETIPSTLKINKSLSNCPTLLNEKSFSNAELTKSTNNGLTFLKQFSSKSITNEQPCSKIPINQKNESKRKSTTLNDYITSVKVPRNELLDTLEDKKEELEESCIDTSFTGSISDNIYSDNVVDNEFTVKSVKYEDFPLIENSEDIIDSAKTLKTEDNCKETAYLGYTDAIPSQIIDISDVIYTKSNSSVNSPDARCYKITNNNTKKTLIIDNTFDKEPIDRLEESVDISTGKIKSLVNERIKNEEIQKNKKVTVKFRGQINPKQNKNCQEELEKEITKEMLSQMKIIGQYNLGFIVTQLEDDLFLVDQHASDEIYNFETLQKTTVLKSQDLCVPQPLELTGLNEQVLKSNLDVLKKNGFTFLIDDDAQPGNRIKLLTMPFSKGYSFGKADIDELLFMLKDAPNENCRPSRIRDMFASRACRKSVMIGSSLTFPEMRTIVNHLGEIEEPWCCPHGRPTIRHLINTQLIVKDKINSDSNS